eukprot:452665_1
MAAHQYEIIDILSIISQLIILFLIISVGVHGLIGFRKSTQIINIFKYLFIFCLFISSIYIFLAVTNDILYIEDKHFIKEGILTAISHGVYMLLLLILLATLIARLYFTFHGSVYAISNAQLFCIIVSYGLAVILAITYIWFFIAKYKVVMYVVAGTMGSIYVVLSIYTTTLFVRALFMLTTLRAISISNITNKNKIKLNQQQIETMTKASQYISLISLALLTSCLRFLLASIIETSITSIQTTKQRLKIWMMLQSLLFSTDCLINVLCLHLQYKFSKKYYDKYCKILENSWRPILILCAEKTMNKRYKTETKSETLDLEHVQCTSVSPVTPSIDNETKETNSIHSYESHYKL